LASASRILGRVIPPKPKAPICKKPRREKEFPNWDLGGSTLVDFVAKVAIPEPNEILEFMKSPRGLEENT
jgi:hypothetical protein